MQDLAALLATAGGRRLLEAAATFDRPTDFLAALQAPATGAADSRFPVYVHQQVYLDYRASVVAKLLALRELARQGHGVEPWFLWIDSDRAGSDKLSLRLYLRGRHGAVPVRLAPTGCEQREPRWIGLDAARLADGTRRIEAAIRSLPGGAGGRLARFDALRPLLLAADTLARLGQSLGEAMFDTVLSFKPRPLPVSHLIATGALTRPLSVLLNQQAAFVEAVNARIAELRDLGIDPRIKPLAADYLPLFLTDPLDGRRRRLRLERDGPLWLAMADDGRGGRHRFPLGRSELTLEALHGAAAWSPDVTLPLLVAPGFSGLVAGRSSALYLLVLQDALRRTLNQAPLPVLVPRQWDIFAGSFDSLFEAFLEGRRL